MNTFRFVILGAGFIGNQFCDAVSRIEGCEVVAVASKSMERAESFAAEHDIPHAYDSYEEMLDAEHPDCAYIAVTPNDHFRLTMLCLDRKIPVLCEKAMFANSSEAGTALFYAEEQQVFAMEALWSRFLPAVRCVRAWLEDDRIGTPTLSQITVGFVTPDDNESRFLNPALAGGVATDITVYAYEITTFLLQQEIRSVQVTTKFSDLGVDLTSHVTLDMEHTLAELTTSFAAPIKDKMIIYGKGGSIVLPIPIHPSECFLYDAEGCEVEHFVDEITQNGFTYEIEEAIRCIREGRLESEVVPRADTLSCAKLFDRVMAYSPDSPIT